MWVGGKMSDSNNQVSMLTRINKIKNIQDDVDLAVFLNEVKIDGLFNRGKYPSTIFGWLDWLREGGNCL